MSPIQQMLLGVGAVAKKTYIDDIFSTYLWAGSGSARSINNGVDLSGEGGLVWIKNRTATENSGLFDTLRGAGKWVVSNSNSAEDTDTNRLSAFNNNGFSLGSDTMVNNSNATYASWTFRRAKGFFDCITFSGDGNLSRQISHSLECKPGMVLLKRTDGQYGWYIWNRGLNGGDNSFRYFIRFDYEGQTDANSVSNSPIQAVSSTTVTLTASSGWDGVNTSGQSYVMYVFAGGEEGYNSVDFDGTNDYLSIPDSTDYDFGTGDFTIEAWVRYEGSNTASTNDTIIDTRNGDSGGNADAGWVFLLRSNGKIGFHHSSIGWQESTTVLSTNTWYHVAITRNGNDFRVFINGTEEADNSHSGSVDAGSNFRIGYKVPYSASSLTYWNGKISNLRIVKGTAVYTSSFTTPTASLTNITNTKLLCCNGDIATSSTVTPGTITASGSPNTTGTSPLTSPDAVFGESQSESVIKCGSYKGNNNSDGPEVNLGFEPSFLILKESSDNGNHWRMYDSMRGIATGGDDAELYPSSGQEEDPNNEFLELTPTGFKLKTSDSAVNDNQTYLYLAVRRSDGYVGKPPSLGTDVFAMPIGTGSGEPQFISNFPVDFNFTRTPDSSKSWYTTARLMGTNGLDLDNSDAEYSYADFTFDHNNGVFKGDGGNWPNTWQSWCWKRHAGFDVVTYKGNGDSDHHILHQMNAVPEMMWLKNRTASSKNWTVFHKGLNGGTDPEDYNIYLNTTAAEVSIAGVTAPWSGTAPTATQFTVGNFSHINGSGDSIIAMLFASVDGISKVGYFSGDGESNREITTGFQPRLLIIRKVTSTASWSVFDTGRGWTNGGAQPVIDLESSNGQANRSDWISRNSTSFTIVNSDYNDSSEKYIYYAHA